MKLKVVILSGVLGASLFAAAASAPADEADGNRTLSVRTVVHLQEAGFPGKSFQGPSGLAKGHTVLPEDGTTPEPRIVRMPKGGTEE